MQIFAKTIHDVYIPFRAEIKTKPVHTATVGLGRVSLRVETSSVKRVRRAEGRPRGRSIIGPFFSLFFTMGQPSQPISLFQKAIKLLKWHYGVHWLQIHGSSLYE